MGLAVFRIAQLISVMTLFQTTTSRHKSTLTKWQTEEAHCHFECKIQDIEKFTINISGSINSNSNTNINNNININMALFLPEAWKTGY